MDNTVKSKRKNYKHLSVEDREAIAIGLAMGKTQQQIAIELDRSPATISREIWRNGKQLHRDYRALRAHSHSQRRKKTSHAKYRLKSPEIREYTRERLKEGWTPEQIAGRLSIEKPGLKTNHESIYLYIYFEARHLYQYLPRSHRKRLKRGLKSTRRVSKIPDRTSIEFRPEEVNHRLRIGDWEADTIVSRSSKVALLVLRERL